MNAVLIIGRLFVAALLIGAGISHFAKLEMMTGYAKYKKLPAAKFGVLISGLFFLAGGVANLLGLWVDLGNLLAGVTLFLAAVIFHNYWKESDATAKQNEMMAFNKDLALAGFALILFALVYSGAVSGAEFGPHIGNISFFN